MIKKSLVALFLVLFTAVFVSPSMAKDITLTCKDCASQFTFTEAEQAFYKEKAFENQPERCPDCRKAKKPQKRNSKRGNGDGRGGYSNGSRW